jgi:IS5 family transposase
VVRAEYPGHERGLVRDCLAARSAGLSLAKGPLPDETTILNYRHFLESHGLTGVISEAVNSYLAIRVLRLSWSTIVDSTIIAAPSSSKNATGIRDPEMHQTKKGNEWHFGITAHIGVDAKTGLVHSLAGTDANVHDITQAECPFHGSETDVFADARFRGVEKEPAKNKLAHRRAARQTQEAHATELRPNPRTNRTGFDQRTRKSRAPLWSGKAPVWIYQIPLPRPCEKHRSVAYAVCSPEPIDGQATFIVHRVSPSKIRENAEKLKHSSKNENQRIKN